MNINDGSDGNSLFDKRIEWLSVEQVSKTYPMSKSMLYKHKQYGIPARKLGKKLLFKRTELDEWLERWAA